MDDRIEHSGDTAATTSNAIGRREMLQRTGFVVGAAALWNTPIIKSISASASVVSGFEAEACVDEDGNLLGAPSSLTFKLVPSPCDNDLNPTVPPWKPGQVNETKFFDPCCNLDPNADMDDKGFPDNGPAEGPYTVEWWFEGNLNTFPTGTPAGSKVLNSGDSFSVFASPGGGGVANIFFRITPTLPNGCEQRFGFHYSCSEPLIIGDRHGSVEITGYVA